MTTEAGDDLVRAIKALNAACVKCGIGQPTVIGLRSNMAVNAVEQAVKLAGHERIMREIIGGIEIYGVQIKQRQM